MEEKFLEGHDPQLRGKRLIIVCITHYLSVEHTTNVALTKSAKVIIFFIWHIIESM